MMTISLSEKKMQYLFREREFYLSEYEATSANSFVRPSDMKVSSFSAYIDPQSICFYNRYLSFKIKTILDQYLDKTEKHDRTKVLVHVHGERRNEAQALLQLTLQKSKIQ